MLEIDIENRVAAEVLHGATDVAVRQAESGWSSAAGKIRRQKRIAFLSKDLDSGAKILEVGCGTGLQTSELFRKFSDIVAIDISPQLLAIAERRAPGPQYQVMDAHHPTFPPGTFDAILGVSILHHLEWETALQSYFQILKPGGIVRFSEPNFLNPQIFLQKNIPILKRWAGDSPDEYAFTKWHIEGCLKRAGFTAIKATPIEFLHPSTPPRLIPLLSRLERILERTPLRHIGGSLLIEAVKG